MNQPDAVHAYHDRSVHHFDRFARSLGYLDWASQPSPFRTYTPTRTVSLFPAPAPALLGAGAPATWDSLAGPRPAAPLDLASLGDLFRHTLGLAAWKQFRESRWVLRVNPSSGNLHPTEGYLVCGPIGPADGPAVYHYAPERHALEERCCFDATAWRDAAGAGGQCLIVLSSIHWREAWKYGERAFRYCQHDLGHVIAGFSVAAAALGWVVELLPEWSAAQAASAAGLDRAADFVGVEREELGCVLRLRPAGVPGSAFEPDALSRAIRGGVWCGRASAPDAEHVQWPVIDEIAEATRWSGGSYPRVGSSPSVISQDGDADRGVDFRRLVKQRRSAQAFDARTAMSLEVFERMLVRVMPSDAAPWTSLWWSPRVHLAIFVHRVTGLEPGLYLLPRDETARGRLEAACGREFGWERASDRVPLLRLASGDARSLARRLSCDQDIAADGCFSLGMLADFDRSLAEHGPGFYRHLFWESGVVGQVLYLEAEAAGLRGTGIGCFYDEAVHDTLGITDTAFRSLYHFTVGGPVEDMRLITERAYPEED